MKKEHVIDMLETIATLLELEDENPFKIRAYTNAARSIETWGGNLHELAQAVEAAATVMNAARKTLFTPLSSIVAIGRRCDGSALSEYINLNRRVSLPSRLNNLAWKQVERVSRGPERPDRNSNCRPGVCPGDD